jgi:hypothetical protein
VTLPPQQGWARGQHRYDEREPLDDVCYVAGCKGLPLEAHHVWARSLIGGDFPFVETPDGQVLGNIVNLCREHHQRVTGGPGGHKAKLTYVEFEDGKLIMIYEDLMNRRLYPMRQPAGFDSRTFELQQHTRPKAVKSKPKAEQKEWIRWKLPAGISSSVLETELEDIALDFGRPKLEGTELYTVTVFDLVQTYMLNRHRLQPRERGE